MKSSDQAALAEELVAVDELGADVLRPFVLTDVHGRVSDARLAAMVPGDARHTGESPGLDSPVRIVVRPIGLGMTSFDWIACSLRLTASQNYWHVDHDGTIRGEERCRGFDIALASCLARAGKCARS